MTNTQDLSTTISKATLFAAEELQARFLRDGFAILIAHLIMPDGQAVVCSVEDTNSKSQKGVLANQIRALGPACVIVSAEAWTVRLPPDTDPSTLEEVSPSNHPDRQEILMLTVECPAYPNLECTMSWDVVRGPTSGKPIALANFQRHSGPPGGGLLGDLCAQRPQD